MNGSRRGQAWRCCLPLGPHAAGFCPPPRELGTMAREGAGAGRGPSGYGTWNLAAAGGAAGTVPLHSAPVPGAQEVAGRRGGAGTQVPPAGRLMPGEQGGPHSGPCLSVRSLNWGAVLSTASASALCDSDGHPSAAAGSPRAWPTVRQRAPLGLCLVWGQSTGQCLVLSSVTPSLPGSLLPGGPPTPARPHLSSRGSAEPHREAPGSSRAVWDPCHAEPSAAGKKSVTRMSLRPTGQLGPGRGGAGRAARPQQAFFVH